MTAFTSVEPKTLQNYRAGRSVPRDNFEKIVAELYGGDETRAVPLRAAFDAVYGLTSPPFGRSPAPAAPARPGRVPRPARLVGRDEDLAAVLDAVLAADGPVAVLLQGGPGMGKTSLTQAVAHHPDCAARFSDSRFYVVLETAATADAMADAIIRALGADPTRGLDAALAARANRPTLLILDNLETPWDPIGERRAVEALLGDITATPGLALLASFRGEDAVSGADWTMVRAVTELCDCAAAELFDYIARWAASADPGFPSLRAALGGVPLAIELVARRAYGRKSLSELWKEWTRLGAELAKHPDYAAGRLTSLPHSIELSLASSRMTPQACRLFALLGQLPAGLCTEDRDALLGEGAADAQDRLRRVGLGVERGDRIDLLPPIREHAYRHRHPDANDTDAWISHFLDVAKLGEVAGGEGGATVIARLVPEHANLEAAVHAAIAIDRVSDAAAIAWPFGSVARMASIPTPSLRTLAGACCAANDHYGAAHCHFWTGTIAQRRSNHEAARVAYEEARPLYRQAGSLLGEANCIQSLGHIALARSDHERARAAYEQAQPLYRQIGSLRGEAACIQSFGHIALRRSDHDGARAAYEQAQSLYLRAGELLGEANCIQSLGDVALARSDHEGARADYEHAQSLYQRVGDPLGEANCIKGLGDVALERSDYEGARAAYERAQPLYRQVGSLLGEANCIQSLGDIARVRSNHEGARLAYEEAQPLYQRVGDLLGEAHCELGFGDVAWALNDRERARAFWTGAFETYRRVGNARGELIALRRLQRLEP